MVNRHMAPAAIRSADECVLGVGCGNPWRECGLNTMLKHLCAPATPPEPACPSAHPLVPRNEGKCLFRVWVDPVCTRCWTQGVFTHVPILSPSVSNCAVYDWAPRRCSIRAGVGGSAHPDGDRLF